MSDIAKAWLLIGTVTTYFGVTAHNLLGLIIGVVSAVAFIINIVETTKERLE